MLRIAHIVTHPIQYFAPLYRAITKISNVQLTVFFGSDFGTRPSYDPGLGREIQFDTPLLEGYAHHFLENKGDGQPGQNRGSFDCPDLDAVLTPSKFDCVWIHGWSYHLQHQAAQASVKNGVPVFFRGETTLLDAPRFSLRWLRRAMLYGRLLRRAAGCLYVGEHNRRFYRSLGIPDRRLKPAHYSVDADFFASQCLSTDERSAYRRQRGASGSDLVVTTVAKLIPRKRVGDLVRALGLCDPSVRLWVLGDGESAGSLRELADKCCPGRVDWFGFTNQRAIPAALSASDVFALASSEETWGLVVNEAMACGLPAIVSDKIGCGEDLVSDGQSGFRFQCGNHQQIAQHLMSFKNAEMRLRMGAKAKEIVHSRYSSAATASQIVSGIKALL